MSGLIAVLIAGFIVPPACRTLYGVVASALAAKLADKPYSLYESGFPASFSREEGLAALGVDSSAEKKEVLQKYRDLIKELHSDTGGTPYMARRLNEAREACLGSNKRK